MSTSAEAALQRQLMDVESAIATLKTRQEEGIAVTSMELPITRQVYKIDTSIKRVACPVCFEDVLESGLRHHMANACVGIEVECPAVGCRQRMPASELKIHMDHKCPVAKRRKWLARQAKTREAEQQVLEAKRQEDTLLKRRAAELERSRLRRHRWPPPSVEDSNESLRPIGADDGVKDVPMDSEKGTEPPVENAITISEPHLQCEQCCHIIILGLDSPEDSGAPIGDAAAVDRQLRRKLLAHKAVECPMRAVGCPNRQFGCHETVPIGKIPQHLKTHCVYEKIKDELIRKSKQRRELVQCSGCGEPQPLMLLKRHEQVDCENRRVPCRNWHLGCPVQVRVKERQLHEDVTIDNSLRSCLFFGGCAARMDLNEDDIVPPWTVEFWMYRPTVEESAKYYIREIIHWRLHLLQCKRQEQQTYKNVDNSKLHMQRMNEDMSKADTMDAKDAAFSLVQEAALALADSSFAVEDAILESEIALERVGLLVTAALEVLKRVLNKGQLERAVDQTVLVTLRDNMTRPPPKKAVDKKALLAAWKASKTASGTPVSTEGADSGDGDLTNMERPVETGESPDDNVDQEEPRDIESHSGISFAAEDSAEQEEEEVSVVEREDDLLELCLTWPDWKWKVENFQAELEFMKAEMALWREQNEIQWKPVPIKAATENTLEMSTPAKQLVDDDEMEEELNMNSSLSKKEKKALAKKRKAEAKQRREEKKLRESLRVSAEEGEDNSTASKEPPRKQLRDRIFEAVRRIQCLDNLMSSPHGNICLNVAGTGRVGIFNALQPLMTEKEKKKSKMKKGDFPDGVHAFDMQAERNKWTHVAVVCSIVPKESVVLYFDGTPMETLPATSFNLPMKWIGNDAFSFHGSLLDLRVWGNPRSTREIKSGRHDIVEFEVDAPVAVGTAVGAGRDSTLLQTVGSTSLLSRPPSAGGGDIGTRPKKTSSNGLVAWWPFEDGLGLSAWDIGPKVVADVTEYRFKTPLAANKRSVLRWVPAMDFPELSLMIPKWTERESEDVEGEVSADEKSAKKINRSELPCPSFRERNVCPYEIRRFHLAKRGRALMSFFPCPLECGEYVKKMDVKFHKQYTCKNRRLKCRFTDFCQMSFFAHALDQHEKYECQRLDSRNVFLEAADAKNAIELCAMCAEPIKVRDMNDHNKEHCAFRQVPCLHGDCHDPIYANQLTHHLKFDCRSKELHRTTLLISRARKRLNYPRPWGFEMILVDVDDKDGLTENINNDSGMAPSENGGSDGLEELSAAPVSKEPDSSGGGAK